MTAGATRAVTVYGKAGWNMLGVFVSNFIGVAPDSITSARVNNGAFRELTTQQWRALNNSFANPDATSLRTGVAADMTATGIIITPPTFQCQGQANSLFMNLRRITAGANIDIAFTYGVNDTLALYPIWVSPVGSGTGQAPKQTVTQPQSTTGLVEANTQG